MSKRKRGKAAVRPEPDDREGDGGPGDRLQKVLAAAGVGSRRDCEELIREGRVEVDRQVVTELGTRVDPVRQEIRVDGEALRQPKRMYFAVNKPINVVTTNFDPSGRPRVIDLVPTEERVFAVGRLDRASEGLILVTNDGEFANRITHPRYGVEKTYLVRVAGSPTEADFARLRKGVYLSDGFCRVQSITAKKRHGQSTDLVMVLNEGRNRELRRILARVGHKVLRLKRIAVGSIKLGDLPPGAWRKLLPQEVEALLQLAREKRKAGKSKKKGRPASGHGALVGNALRGVPSPAKTLPNNELPSTPPQSLFTEPLSLDDLLRDDLDEGNIADSGAVAPPEIDDRELHFSDDAPPRKRGGVIAYDDSSAFERKPDAPASEPRKKPARNRKPNASARDFRRKPDASARGNRAKNRPRPTQSHREADASRPPERGPESSKFVKKPGKPGKKKFAGTGGKKHAGRTQGKLIRTGGRKFGKSSARPGGKRKGRR